MEADMKKFLIILGIILLGNISFAEEVTLSGEVKFDWLNMSQIERDTEIEGYQKSLFGENIETDIAKKEFRSQYKNFLKDKNYKTSYQLAINGITETSDARICSFFYKESILYMYAIQFKNTPRFAYYYSPLGALKYMDIMSENYPNFPYYSKQYRSNGTLAGAIYFVSHDLQYIYKPDGTFKGVWYKDKMFDRNAKQILTRTNW